MTITPRAIPTKTVSAAEPELVRSGARTEASRRVYEQLRSRLNIARILVSERLRRDLTQKDVAAIAGTRQSRVSELEGGDANFRIETLDRVARALGLEVTLQPRAPATRIVGLYRSVTHGETEIKVTSVRIVRMADGRQLVVPLPGSDKPRSRLTPANPSAA